jgi:hypothetical protein
MLCEIYFSLKLKQGRLEPPVLFSMRHFLPRNPMALFCLFVSLFNYAVYLHWLYGIACEAKYQDELNVQGSGLFLF